MIDFHISGTPTLTKHWLLEKLCHTPVAWSGPLSWEQKSSLAGARSSLTCNVHANRHTFNSRAWWWSVTCETVGLYDLQTKLTVKFPSWKSSCDDGSFHFFTSGKSLFERSLHGCLICLYMSKCATRHGPLQCKKRWPICRRHNWEPLVGSCNFLRFMLDLEY